MSTVPTIHWHHRRIKGKIGRIARRGRHRPHPIDGAVVHERERMGGVLVFGAAHYIVALAFVATTTTIAETPCSCPPGPIASGCRQSGFRGNHVVKCHISIIFVRMITIKNRKNIFARLNLLDDLLGMRLDLNERASGDLSSNLLRFPVREVNSKFSCLAQRALFMRTLPR